jgi:hypothetical protein
MVRGSKREGLLARRRLLRLVLGGVASAAVPWMAVALAGCSGGSPPVELGQLPDLTADTLGDLLLGPPPDPTAVAPPDPPLLKKGEKERVLVAVDTAGFAKASRGAITESVLKQMRSDAVKLLNRRLVHRGFLAIESPVFPPVPPTDDGTLVALLVPATEDEGSPQDFAHGKQRSLIMVRMTVTDPVGGAVLRERDYYSGKDALNPNNTPQPAPT